MFSYQSICTFFKGCKKGASINLGINLAALYSETAKNAAIWGAIWMHMYSENTFPNLKDPHKLGQAASFLTGFIIRGLVLTAGASATTTCLIAPLATAVFLKCMEKSYTYCVEPEIMEEIQQSNSPRRQALAGRSFMVS